VLIGHDRGARVAHRFALDHPALLTRLVLLDIAPTYDVFARTDQVSARARWHWFFHQLPDLPEALVAGREEIYLRHMYQTSAYNPAAIEEEAVREYVRCFRQPGAMRAAFDDYRAGATIDLEQDGADRDKKVAAPTLILWGEAGGRKPQVPDMLGVWKERCVHVVGHAVPGSGHFIPEEQPAAVIEAVLRFVGDAAKSGAR
jgi:haloacetate dehalogenase